MFIKDFLKTHSSFSFKIWQNEIVIWNNIPNLEDNFFSLISNKEIKNHKIFENVYGDKVIELEIF